MARIIPGVQVTVVKEVVPAQLAPSGVLGLIGLTELALTKTVRASSWSRFLEVCGAASAYSVPEARLALANGVFELVIAPLASSTATKAAAGMPAAAFTLTAKVADLTAKVTVNGNKFDLTITPTVGNPENYTKLDPGKFADSLKDSNYVLAGNLTSSPPKAGDYPLQKDKEVGIPPTVPLLLKLEARAPGIWANGFKLKVSYRDNKFDLEIKPPTGDAVEVHRNLEPATVADYLEKSSAVVRIDSSVAPVTRPGEGEYVLTGGTDVGATAYADALEALKDEPDVDMVLAAVQDFSDRSKVTQIYSAVISHCNLMSADSKGRIGFGQVPPTAKVEDSTAMASTLLSDRFVLLAPHGVVGTVAGRVGGLDYFQSPTFKTLSGLAILSRALPLEEQSSLLKGYAVPVVDQRGRGVIILRGLTTDGDQISVRRVADRAVRGVKMLGELFIGRLNNEDGRGALKQKLNEFLVQMEKEGALVPSTDGKDPAFKVDVYSSQADFALGIVRVDIAVRPVRAIDFIYATIFVQV